MTNLEKCSDERLIEMLIGEPMAFYYDSNKSHEIKNINKRRKEIFKHLIEDTGVRGDLETINFYNKNHSELLEEFSRLNYEWYSVSHLDKYKKLRRILTDVRDKYFLEIMNRVIEEEYRTAFALWNLLYNFGRISYEFYSESTLKIMKG